mgnify:CR=1 FL=1
MALIPRVYMDTLVTISVDDKNGRKFCIGTGFLVGKFIKEENNKRCYAVFLITNKHVFDNYDVVSLGFNQFGTYATNEFGVSLKNNSILNYSSHVDPNVDIVALNLNANVLNSTKSKYSFFALDENTLYIEDMKNDDVYEGDLVNVLGFPMNLVDFNHKDPICRIGCISKISNLYTPGSPDKNFIIDAQAFPGNSGGPVILRPELTAVVGTKPHVKAVLIGILHSYIPYQDKLKSLQTNEIVSITTENSGLTYVHPVDYIRDVIDLEMQRIDITKITYYEQKVESTNIEPIKNIEKLVQEENDNTSEKNKEKRLDKKKS